MKSVAMALATGLLMISGGAMAEGLQKSLLPKARPVQGAVQDSAATPVQTGAPVQMVVATVSTANAIIPPMKPLRRPDGLAERYAKTLEDLSTPKLDPGSVTEVAAVTLVKPLLRPKARPANLDTTRRAAPPEPEAKVIKTAALRTLPGKSAVLPKKGGLCGDPSIRGQSIAPVTSRVKGCGIDDPVKVTEIAGVKLSPAATISCDTALAAKSWIERGIQPAFDNQVVKLQIAGSYVCRPRNGKKGAKVSEHGRGRALDVAAFVLADGRALSVERDYRKSRAIKAAHKAACGPFGTTLGPGSDGYHEDHLHVDIVSYRNGTYCK